MDIPAPHKFRNSYIIGAPGTGKTILIEQYIFRNATIDRPALYLSTVSEPFDKVIRYLAAAPA